MLLRFFVVFYAFSVIFPASFCEYYEEFEDPEYKDEMDATGCQTGWTANGDYCYRYFYEEESGWLKAEQSCQKYAQRGHLASIHSRAEMNVIYKLVLDEGTHWRHLEHYHRHGDKAEHVWIGLSFWCPSTTNGRILNNARWTDGTQVNYDLSHNIKAVIGSSNNCGGFIMGGMGSMPSWVAQKCDITVPYVCKAPKNNQTVENSTYANEDDVCDAWDWCQYNGKCYKLQTTKQVWSDAQTSCQQAGGDLFSVHSKSEDSFFSNTFLNGFDPGSKFWTGLNKYETMDEMLSWSDGSSLDYFPSLTVDFKQWRSASCVHLTVPRPSIRTVVSTRNLPTSPESSNVWNVARCDEKHMSVCVKPFNNATARLSSQDEESGNCSRGFIHYGNRCYKAFGVKNATEKMSYFEAQRKCNSIGANLVGIKDIFENYFVLSLLNTSHNQSWIGLYTENYQLKWVDQSKVVFTSIDEDTLSLNGWETDQHNSPDETKSRISGWDSNRCFVMSIDKWPGVWEPIWTSKNIQNEIKSHHRRKRQDFQRRKRGIDTDELLNDHGSDDTDWPTRRKAWYTRSYGQASCDNQKSSFVCEKSVSKYTNSYKLNVFLMDLDVYIDFVSEGKVPEDSDELSCDYNASLDVSTFKYGNGCYAFVSATAKSWKAAEDVCRQGNGNLVSITSVYEFGFLVSMARNLKIKQFWTGLTDQKQPGLYKWSDGWPIHYTRWDRNEPTKKSYGQCIKMKLDDKAGGLWSATDCTDSLPFACKRSSDLVPKADVVEGTCEPGWVSGSTLCYMIRNKEISRGTDSIVKCLREYQGGSTLATFPTNDDVERLTKRTEIFESKRRFFIGLIQKMHGSYEWLTNDPLTFVRWAPGEPKFAWNANVEVCVEMDHKGLWYGVGCYESRHFICSKPKQISELSNETSPSTATAQALPSQTKGTTPPPTTPSPVISFHPARKLYTSIPPATIGEKPVGFVNDSGRLNGTKLYRPSPSKLSDSSKTTKTSNSGSNVGAALGITFCVIFFILLFTLLAIFLYRRHTAGGGILNYFRRSSAQMRFEVLNENDEM